jgi:hypothetical protein
MRKGPSSVRGHLGTHPCDIRSFPERATVRCVGADSEPISIMAQASDYLAQLIKPWSITILNSSLIHHYSRRFGPSEVPITIMFWCTKNIFGGLPSAGVKDNASIILR